MRKLLAICASLTLLAACGPAPSGPSPSPSPSSSTTPGGSVAVSGSVTASRQAYATYLNCINSAHPDSGAAIMANTVLNVYTDAMWASLKVVADGQVQAFTRTYGKKCGA